MVVGAIEAGGDRRSQTRFEIAHLRAAEPLCREIAAAMEVVAEPQPFDLVAGEREDENTALAEIDADAGGRLQRPAELRPHALTFQCEREQLGLARLMLRRGREHAGRGKARPRADPFALEHRNREPALGKPPGDRQADQPGADDRHLDRRGDRGRLARARPSRPARAWQMQAKRRQP